MEKIINWLKSRSSNMQVMMMVVGGYICYLGYQLFTDADKTEGSVVPIYIFAVVFLICGALIALLMLYALVNGYCREKNPTADDDVEDVDDNTLENAMDNNSSDDSVAKPDDGSDDESSYEHESDN